MDATLTYGCCCCVFVKEITTIYALHGHFLALIVLSDVCVSINDLRTRILFPLDVYI